MAMSATVFDVSVLYATVAKKILEDGVTLFNTRVPPHIISQEKYAHVNACMKCCRLEEHNTRACPSKTKVCSECTSTSHTFKENRGELHSKSW